jgi:hypothetical protein
MKTFNRKSFLVASLCAFALSFGTVAYAEKGAERLATFTKPSAPAVAQAAAPMAHKCASCTDTLVSIVDKGTKGPNHLVTKAFRHNCAGCDTKIVTEGVGKAKYDVALHSCNAAVKPICCASQ